MKFKKTSSVFIYLNKPYDSQNFIIFPLSFIYLYDFLSKM